MQPWLDKLIDITAIEGDQSNLEGALAGLTEQMGFNSYAYLNIQAGHILTIKNYHQEWRSVYFERNYPSIDPVVKRAKSTKRTFTWAGELESSRLSKREEGKQVLCSRRRFRDPLRHNNPCENSKWILSLQDQPLRNFTHGFPSCAQHRVLKNQQRWLGLSEQFRAVF
jgi:hypothetical protein